MQVGVYTARIELLEPGGGLFIQGLAHVLRPFAFMSIGVSVSRLAQGHSMQNSFQLSLIIDEVFMLNRYSADSTDPS